MSRQQESELAKECVEYFRQNSVWEKVLKGFREKYFSYGKFAGSIILRNPSLEEIEELEGFFGKNFHRQKSVSISAEKFQKVLENSRYKEITPDMLLESYFGQPLRGKQEEKLLKEQKRQELLRRVSSDYEGTPAQAEMEYILQMLKGNNREDFAELEQQLRLSAEIFNRLPYRKEQKIYLAVFAAMLTGNPHAFDQGTEGGRILYQMVERNLELRNLAVSETEIFAAYKRQKSYLAAGILLDDVSNYAMLCNVEAVKKDGSIHRGMDGFLKENDMIQVPLAVIADWKEMRCRQQKIYIVENPSVFAMLCGKTEQGQMDTLCSCMCMNGQPRLAGLMILDLLAESGTTIYYSGDLDPEGILIAQKLADYYKGKFYFWHMDVEDYEKCRSEETISDRRMKILDKITDARLIPVVNQIRKYKTAGYQEMVFSDNIY